MKKSKHRSIKDLAHKARSGDVKAAFQLYQNYRDGSFVDQDASIAEDYATKALSQLQTPSLIIASLKLVDFRVFESPPPLSFCNNDPDIPKLMVLVGVNGAGKTSILDAIAFSLSWLILRIVHPPNSGKGTTIEQPDIRRKNDGLAEYASAVVDIQLNPELEYRIELSKTKTASNSSRKNDVEEIGQLGGLYKLANAKKPDFNMPVMAYYGVERSIGFTKKDTNKVMEEKIGDAQNKFDGYDKALNAKIDFVVFFKWFKQQTEIAGLEIGEAKLQAEASLEAVKQAIGIIMPILKNLRIQRTPILDMLIDKDGVTFSVDQLSQGEKSLLALIFDITRRLILLNPDTSQHSPLEGHGIVLIDEIDLHLHPAWQQKVVPSLIVAFPNIQFILTTHSPQVLSTIPHECIRLLDNGEIFGVSKGTCGAESSRLLKRIFDVDPRPQDIENARLLNRYMDKVYDDRWTDREVIEMRIKLDAIFGDEEPELDRADLYIENKKWELELEEDQ